MIPIGTPRKRSTVDWTIGVLITWRFSVTVSRLRPRVMPSVTLVPARPRIRAVEAALLRPASAWPSTAVIRSPARIPARAAGVPGTTLSTSRPAAVAMTSMPTPEKRSGVGLLKAL